MSKDWLGVAQREKMAGKRNRNSASGKDRIGISGFVLTVEEREDALKALFWQHKRVQNSLRLHCADWLCLKNKAQDFLCAEEDMKPLEEIHSPFHYYLWKHEYRCYWLMRRTISTMKRLLEHF